jgi:indolepyruvate ferredoxin oxidoreductase, alpha subunit
MADKGENKALKRSGEVVIGNFGIARGLVEAGLELAAAYPGTPSSEILPGIIEFNRRENRGIYAEWSTNERCAFEVAYGAAMAGRKAACMMKQVGLNVAFPSLLQGLEKPINGGLVIVSCDDPGPQSSQTEQDTRLLAALFRIPILDPGSPAEAADAAFYALEYSFEYKVPVILRSTHRVSHAREFITFLKPGARRPDLDEGIEIDGGRRLGIVASGMTASIAMDVLSELGAEEKVSLYRAVRISPPAPELFRFVDEVEKILVLEETDQALEALIAGGDRVFGRRNGWVPSAGELTYDVVRGVTAKVLNSMGLGEGLPLGDGRLETLMSGLSVPPRPPRLCAGCSHRASFYAMRYASPEAIFPGDIGCYTLGIAMGGVDTCLDMGGSVTLAAGFYEAYKQDGVEMPIIASIGDSTFFHAALSPLCDAVDKGKRFLLVIMDNGTTAMTGMQPTPQSGFTAQGAQTREMPIEGVLKGLKVDFVQTLDPYDVPAMVRAVNDALDYLKKDGAKPAVIVARRPCLLSVKGGRAQEGRMTVPLEEGCTGCMRCTRRFDCPGLIFDKEAKRARTDPALCTQCGVCLYLCPAKAERKKLPKTGEGLSASDEV